MQNSKRIQRALKDLETLEDDMMYYTNGNQEYRQQFKDIRNLIDELSLSRKQDRARLAKRLKAKWVD